MISRHPNRTIRCRGSQPERKIVGRSFLLLAALLVALAGPVASQIKAPSDTVPPPTPPAQEPCHDDCCDLGGKGGSGGGGGGFGGGPGHDAGFNGKAAGDPVSLLDGALRFRRTDLVVDGLYPIRIVRTYDSQSLYDSSLGYGWAFAHDRRLFVYPDQSVTIRSGCGYRSHFAYAGGNYVVPRDGMRGELVKLPDGAYEFRHRDGTTSSFDDQGRLVSTRSREGHTHEYIYNPAGKMPLVGTSPHSVDPDRSMVVAEMHQLARIQERSADGALTGYAVDFFYHAETGRLVRIESDDGRELHFQHDSIGPDQTRGNLMSVVGLSNYSQTYLYEDPSDPHNITSLQDSTDSAPVVNVYDGKDRVVSQVHGSSQITFNYETPRVRTTYVRRVLDDAGSQLFLATHLVEFDEAGYFKREVNPAGHEYRLIYDANKNVERSELWQSLGGQLNLFRTINYSYDALGKKEAEWLTLATGETITKSWTYDHGWIASEQTVSSLAPTRLFRTEYSFNRDSQGRPTTISAVKRRQDDGSFSTTSFAYCTPADIALPDSTCPYRGLLKSMDGPRDDLRDTTDYTYRSATDLTGCESNGPCYRKGNAWRVTNALGHSIEFGRYDRAGRLTQRIDTNGIVAEMTYHARGWLLSQNVRGPGSAGDAITTYAYNGAGNLTRITLPTGAYLDYSFDARNRLSGITDNMGNRIDYSLDSEGNRLRELTHDSQNQIQRTASAEYDILGSLHKSFTAQGQATVFTHDAAGNRSSTSDPAGTITLDEHDELNRVVRTTQDLNGLAVETQYEYDAIGNLRKVIDPNGLSTDYDYDALGNLVALASPDTGSSVFGHDATGNRVEHTDGRQITIASKYDEGNRLIEVIYPTLRSVTFSYDQEDGVTGCSTSYPVGRLTSVTDAMGTSWYCYDHRGNLTQKRWDTGIGPSLSVSYSYDLSDRLDSLTYPSGRRVDFARDVLGKLESIEMEGTTASATIASSITHLPFGPASTYVFGNSQVLNKAHDQDYWVTDVISPALSLHFRRDALGNIDRLLTSAGSSSVLEQYSHDPLHRLEHVEDSLGSTVESYDYDGTGNRKSKSTPDGLQDYNYAQNSHRLVKVNGASRSYDDAGNTLTDQQDSRSYIYDERGRLSAFQGDGGIAEYEYNSRGERVYKSATVGGSGSVSLFVYDEAGRLLGEYQTNGAARQEFVWADNTPVAILTQHPILEQDEVLYIHADHLGTPRAVSNTAGTKVWEWAFASNPFGEQTPNADPDGDLVDFVFNLRYPGQYMDVESGLHHNYFRDYEPGTGRYVQSDPIGLSGGISTFGYVSQNPLKLVDPRGLLEIDPSCSYCDENGDVGGRIRNAAQLCVRATAGIWNSARARCIRKRCERDGIIVCNDFGRCPPGRGGSNTWNWIGSRDSFLPIPAPSNELNVCVRNISHAPYLLATIVLHEAAHSCGWSHDDNENVP